MKRVRLAVGAALAVGLLLRVREFLYARPLWGDEAALALNLAIPLKGLLEPLRNGQMAPVGFLLLEKISIGFLGTSEQALRLVPFLAGVATLVLLFPVARRYAGTSAAVLVVWFGALSQHLVYYANEVKQYSSDVAIALVILLVAHRVAGPENRRVDWALFAVVGAIAVWFSHPAVLVLAGAGLVLFAANLRRGDRPALASTVGAAAVWLASFVLLYVLLLHEQTGSQPMRDYWSFAFVPLPPTGLSDIRWFHEQLYEFFRDPVGLRAGGLAAFAFAVGIAAWIRKDRLHLLAFLLVPAVVTAGVSATGNYPFQGRLLLFLVPGVLIVIARGLVAALDVSRAGGVLLAALLLMTPVIDSLTGLESPSIRYDLRSVLERVEESVESGDSFILHYSTVSQFHYYRYRRITTIRDFRVFGTWGGLATGNREEIDNLADIIPREGRFWVILSRSTQLDRIVEETLLLQRAADFGRETLRFDAVGETAVLFTVGDHAAEGSGN